MRYVIILLTPTPLPPIRGCFAIEWLTPTLPQSVSRDIYERPHTLETIVCFCAMYNMGGPENKIKIHLDPQGFTIPLGYVTWDLKIFNSSL